MGYAQNMPEDSMQKMVVHVGFTDRVNTGFEGRRIVLHG